MAVFLNSVWAGTHHPALCSLCQQEWATRFLISWRSNYQHGLHTSHLHWKIMPQTTDGEFNHLNKTSRIPRVSSPSNLEDWELKESHKNSVWDEQTLKDCNAARGCEIHEELDYKSVRLTECFPALERKFICGAISLMFSATPPQKEGWV